MKNSLSKKNALTFIVLLGFVSLFADMTYEGARSIAGQYLASFGANGVIIGFVAGLGELFGYSLRLLSGYLSDKTGKYWFITILGYIINLLSVPLLAFANNWPLAASLLVLERLGKSIRAPAKDAMLSYATHQVGRGWGFGLHEAMDQMGAVTGPLIISIILWYRGSYQESFAILTFPALLALAILLYARKLHPHPQNLEVKSSSLNSEGIAKQYWIYITAISCIAAGYMDFPLIAYHLKKESLISDASIPLFFAAAMASDGMSALIFGKMYDKKGILTVIIATILGASFAPLIFLGHSFFVILGIIMWGIGLGAQESIMRAVVADLVPVKKRGTGYGILNMWFGIFWFLGSVLMGYLYDYSIITLIIFSTMLQLIAVPLLFIIKKSQQ